MMPKPSLDEFPLGDPASQSSLGLECPIVQPVTLPVIGPRGEVSR